MADTRDGPPLLRPVPRRPFGLNLREPTPPVDESSSVTPDREPVLNLDSLNAKLLDPRSNSAPGSGSTSISRAESVMNLTSSTLMGIYSPTTYGKDRFYAAGDEPTTPWGTGAETPARTLDANDPNYEVQQERTHTRRRRSTLHSIARPPPLSTPAYIFHLGVRGLLLSSLGILYGILVAQVRYKQKSAFNMESFYLQGIDWQYMTFWGVAGVVLGLLLPWFDGLWEATFGEEELESTIEHTLGGDEAGTKTDANTDWTLAVRGIGAFLGIAFAIRKLPWDSTLQVSLTLALVNPMLWFLIDRSMPGFVVSSAVGATGTAIMMAMNPDLVPVPRMSHPFGMPSGSLGNNGTTTSHGSDSKGAGGNMLLGGLTSQETIATGIWLLNVLFCCCVCFGNIGRWLSPKKAIVVRR